MRLIEAIPTDYHNDFINYKSYRYRNENVKKIHSNMPWPKQKQKNVFMWFTLTNGRIVGINESPEGIISFPTKDIANVRKPIKTTKSNNSNKKRKSNKKKRPGYIRVGTLTPEEFFAIQEPNVTLFEHKVSMRSHRYTNFRVNGLECKHCGVKGEFFALEKDFCNRNSNRAHFNLYGYTVFGAEVMLTKDHIMPKSKGGANHIDNYQVLCSKCNVRKGAIIPKGMKK